MEVDFIKVRDWLSPGEYSRVLTAANYAGLPTVGHLATAVSLEQALASGQQTIEHSGGLFGGLLLACSSIEDQLRADLLWVMGQAIEQQSIVAALVGMREIQFLSRVVKSYNPDKAARLVASMANSETAVVPTLLVNAPGLQGSNPLFDGRKMRDEPFMKYVPQKVVEMWKADPMGRFFDVKQRQAMQKVHLLQAKLLQQLQSAGVPVLAGTDAALMPEVPWNVPGFSLHDELMLLVNAGLTPMEAIIAGSSASARVMQLDGVDTIAKGKAADMVLLASNPLEDIRNTRTILTVISNGQLFDRNALDELLAVVEAEAAGKASATRE